MPYWINWKFEYKFLKHFFFKLCKVEIEFGDIHCKKCSDGYAPEPIIVWKVEI